MGSRQLLDYSAQGEMRWMDRIGTQLTTAGEWLPKKKKKIGNCLGWHSFFATLITNLEKSFNLVAAASFVLKFEKEIRTTKLVLVTVYRWAQITEYPGQKWRRRHAWRFASHYAFFLLFLKIAHHSPFPILFVSLSLVFSEFFLA